VAISFTCPECGNTTQVADSYAGQSGPCSNCGATVTVPGKSIRSSSGGSGAKVAMIVIGTVVVGLLVCGGGLAALLYPAITAARDAAQRVQSMNNLKQISMALHNYHDTYGTFPPAYLPDENGQPMHSWRVLILPYLEQQNLYDQYDFDVPWNDPNNQMVTSADLPIYRSPIAPSEKCSYFVLDVPGGVFDGPKATSLNQITDGQANTFLVVEVVGSTAHWAEPVDLGPQAIAAGINGAQNGTAISGHHRTGAIVVMADGSVLMLDDNTAQATLQNMATMSDGQPVAIPY